MAGLLGTVDGALHSTTPLILSPTLSARSGCRVLLKLESLQPSGSFKSRGVGAQCIYQSLRHGGRGRARLVCSSGGNAGLACAFAAQQLGVECTVFVPWTTKPAMVRKLKARDAEVVQGGSAWHEADSAARRAVSLNPTAAYIHPFSNPELVEGNSTLITEVAEQLRARGTSETPHAIVCSTGGGGLLHGILHGLASLPSWDSTEVLAVETHGASSLLASLKASYGTLPTARRMESLKSIDSIASSLGATQVSEGVVDACLARERGVTSVSTPDEATIDAALRFLDDHQQLLEPACAASLAPLLEPDILAAALPADAAARMFHNEVDRRPLVVAVICGGNGVDLAQLLAWRDQFAGAEGRAWKVWNGARGVDKEGVWQRDFD